MKKLFLFLLLIAGLSATDYDYITITGTPSQSINYVSYEIGIYDVNASGVPINITQLGRMKAFNNSQSHTVTVYSTSNVALGSVVLNMAGKPNDQMVWGTLSTPISIAAGQAFYVLSTETGGSEILYGPNGYTFTAPFGSFYPGDRQGGTLHTAYPSSPSTNYGPVNYRFDSPPIPGWTKTLVSGHYVYDCLAEQYAVASAIADSTAGDTINLPILGSATWGAQASSVFLNKAVTVNGRGTTINIASTGATFSTAGVFVVTGGTGARITGITFQQPASAQTTAIVVSTLSGSVIDNCTYNGITATNVDPGYFIYYANVGGLYHSNTINTFSGRDEYVVSRGPTDAWITPLNPGTANAVYGEDNVVTGPGYCDANSNGRMVQRFSTLTGTGKLDGHGYSTNTPRYGVRLFESYMNAMTNAGPSSSTSVEMRGGSVLSFFNIAANPTANFTLVDYAYTEGSWDGYLTPYNYLLPFQIGTGQMATSSAQSLVVGKWAQIKTTGNANWTSCGFANSNVGTAAIVTAIPTGTTGDAYIMAAGDKGYVFGNKRAGSTWPIFNGNVNSAAITLYRTQTGNPSATFTGADIIMSNRDYFADAGAAANTGVYIATSLTMPSPVGKLGQGCWVTDEGSWNVRFTGTISASSLANNYWCEIVFLGNTNWQAIGAPAGAVVGTQFRATGAGGVGTTGTAKPAQGRLYVSDNTNWVLYYTPYTYPHPLRGGAPIVTTATINAAGTQMSFGLSESCTTGPSGNTGVTITASGGPVTWTYNTGSGSTTYTGDLSRPIQSGESVSFGYTQPGAGIRSTATQTNLATFTGFIVTNGSTVNASQASGLRNQAALGAGF